MKKVAILQSNYIPWKGYFDIINMVDEFIIYDCVQYTKNDWRNRNMIKTSNGLMWLSVPCYVKSLHQNINQTKISDALWAKKHLKTLTQNYSKAKYFKEYMPFFEDLYNKVADETLLSSVNLVFIKAINELLGIKTKISKCEDFNLIDGQTKRLLKLCQDSGATTYVSGPSAKNYLDESMFNSANIAVEWVSYDGYKPYNQLYGEFTHTVSIVDLIFNEGRQSTTFMKSFGEKNDTF